MWRPGARGATCCRCEHDGCGGRLPRVTPTALLRPTSSLLLQLLVSIQGLILVPDPYFNEPGYEKQVATQEGLANASMYNESAFLLTVRSTIALLRSKGGLPQHVASIARAVWGSSSGGT